MVKFKFWVDTPYGGYYNTHYAKNAKRAIDTLEKWNTEFEGTDYSVHLVDIKATKEELPSGYTVW